MEKDGGIYVSETASKNEFLSLNLDTKGNSPRQDISRAIEIFRSRIKGRYLSQIKTLNRSPYSNGFASMALCCLLVDTFYQFEHGVKKTTDNKHAYVDFLRNNLGDVFDTQEKANRFYVDIRCGILHSAQTTNGSHLTVDGTDIVTTISNDINSPISVNVVAFGTRLEAYFNEYCNRVRIEKTTQSNFVKKLKKMFS